MPSIPQVVKHTFNSPVATASNKFSRRTSFTMSRKVEMVRMTPDESFSAIEQERSAAEVFGNANKFQKVDQATLDKALEGKTTKFVSEAELQQNKDAHGVSREDGTFSGRTLTEAIIAQREEKERKFQEDWKIMKQGKYRPLEEDEVEFLNGLAKQEVMKEKKKLEEEKMMMQKMEEIKKKSMESATAAPATIKRQVAPKVRAAVKKPAIGVKRKQPPPAANAKASSVEPAAVDKPVEPQSDAAHCIGSGPTPGSAAPSGLGLLGDYDSSDSEE